MCFSPEMSAFFSVVGVLIAAWVLKATGNKTVSFGIFYFVLMEALQFVQYIYIAEDVDPVNPTAKSLRDSAKCQAAENQVLTLLGFLHICFQPLFTTWMSCGFARSVESRVQFKLVNRLCFCGGAWLFGRSLLALYPGFFDNLGLGEIIGNAEYYGTGGDNGHNPRDWLSGGVLCTYKGTKHLAWSVPMVSPSYYVPAGSIHSFLMFMPFFLVDHGKFSINLFNWTCGLAAFLFGPILGDYITPNKHEAASIWCFFSIVQCCSLVVTLAFWNPWPREEEVDKNGHTNVLGDAKKKAKAT